MKIPGSIILIGPMGVGKTTIGRQLAELVEKQFIDADTELEKQTGAEISLIFEIEGESGFRKRESKIIDKLTQIEEAVLATGGGVVLSKRNRELIRSRGLVVYLHADIDTLVKRTRRDKSRPLLQKGDKRSTIIGIMEEREPIYRQIADLIVETDDRPPALIAKQIVKGIKALKSK